MREESNALSDLYHPKTNYLTGVAWMESSDVKLELRTLRQAHIADPTFLTVLYFTEHCVRIESLSVHLSIHVYICLCPFSPLSLFLLLPPCV